MWRKMIMLAAVAFFVLSAPTGNADAQQSSIAGRYFSESYPEYYIELRPNRTFVMPGQGRLRSVTGTYEVSGDHVTFRTMAESPAVFKLADNILTDPHGNRWTRRSPASAAEGPLPPSSGQPSAPQPVPVGVTAGSKRAESSAGRGPGDTTARNPLLQQAEDLDRQAQDAATKALELEQKVQRSGAQGMGGILRLKYSVQAKRWRAKEKEYHDQAQQLRQEASKGQQNSGASPSPTPQSASPPAVAPVASSTSPTQSASSAQSMGGCSGAYDLGYSLRADNHVYQLKAIGPPGPNQIHLFFDEAGALVQDANLLQELALGAWTKERVVDRYNPGVGSGQVKMFLSISSNLEGWQDATDVLARATVESIKAVVTGGISLNTAAQNLTLGMVERQLTNPKVALAHWARAGLLESLADYTQMEGLLPPAGTTVFKLSDLNEIDRLYTQANTLASAHEALVAAIAPTTWQDEFANYISGAASQLAPSLPASTTLLTLNDVLKLEQFVASTGQSFSAYKQSLDLALKVAASNQQAVSSWATQAAQACSLAVATSSGKSMAFGYSNADGTAILSTMAEGGTSNPTENPREFDAAICSDSTAVRVSFERYQNPGVNDNGRDWARNFDQRGGQRLRVVGGRAPADASCLLTTQAFLAGKRFLSFKQEKKAIACDSQTTSQLGTAGRRGVHFCRQFAAAAPSGQLLAVEFDRRGNDLLAGIVLKMGDQLFIHQLPAKYDQDNVTGWRVGDQGHLFNYDQNASFLDLEVVNVFRPLFALKDEATGAVALGIQWAGEEGLSLMLLSTSREKLEEAAKGYRYMAPL